MIWTLKNAIKNWGHRACLRISRFLKWGYFYWLRIKSSNHFHTELSHGYLKDTKFYLESKASFIDMSSIASFKLFLITWLWEILHFFGQFCGSLEVLALAKIRPVGSYFPQKNCVLLSNFFSSSNMFFIRLFLANTREKIGGHRAYLREKENLFHYRAWFEGNLLRFARAHAHVHALMTWKACEVEMRNAILRNYLKTVICLIDH